MMLYPHLPLFISFPSSFLTFVNSSSTDCLKIPEAGEKTIVYNCRTLGCNGVFFHCSAAKSKSSIWVLFPPLVACNVGDLAFFCVCKDAKR